jgi:hypothetical protein
MIVPDAVVHPERLEQALRALPAALGPEIVAVHHRVRQDWTGEFALFLGVVVADAALDRYMREDRLSDLVSTVTAVANRYADEHDLGLPLYVSFRSESEARLKSNPVDSWL